MINIVISFHNYASTGIVPFSSFPAAGLLDP